MIRAIIFDFDGVILESADIKTEAFRRLFEKSGPKKIAEIVDYHKRNMGISRNVKFRHIYRNILNLPLTADQQKSLEKEFASLVVRQVLEVPFVPGAEEFLKANWQRFSLFVASGTPEEELIDIAKKRKIFHYFSECHGFPKEKKEIILDILNRRHWQTQQAIFVGDAESDRRASEEAGVPFVARVNGKNSFYGAGSDHKIKDLNALSGLLGTL